MSESAMRVLLAAWRPFLDPLDVHATWWVWAIPMVIAVSVAYKAVRLPSLKRYWWHVLRMSVQILAAMVLMAVGLYVIVEIVVTRT